MNKLTPKNIFETWSHPNCVKSRHDRLYQGTGKPRLDNYGKPRPDYAAKLKAMDMPALETETEQMIWLSAYAGNNPRSDYHWQVDCCYDELMERTQSDEAYDKCYKRVERSL